MNCTRCGFSGEPKLSNVGVHVRADCGQCGKYLKFIPQGEPKLPQYLRWLKDQRIKASLKAHIETALSS